MSHEINSFSYIDQDPPVPVPDLGQVMRVMAQSNFSGPGWDHSINTITSSYLIPALILDTPSITKAYLIKCISTASVSAGAAGWRSPLQICAVHWALSNAGKYFNS